MSKLKAVKPKQAKPVKPKTIIFGKAGVGKTWASLDFPRVYYIDTEGGAVLNHYTDKLESSGGAYLGVEQGSNDLDTITEQVKALYTEDHDFKTLVIDSISKPFNEAIQAEADRLGDKNGFGADKKGAIAKIRPLIALIEKIDMNVILIAHEKPLWAEGEQDGWTFDCWEKIGYDLHMACHITKVGKKRFMTPTKSRLINFPEEQPIVWSFDEFKERYEKEFGEGILSAEVEAVKLASDETRAEFKKLAEALNLDKAKASKWLKASKCESFADMEEEILKKHVASLKAELAKISQ